ncbi:MAG TPA: TIGR03790 family protein, partial [Deltaproteobacteria bacterium]|nr:TIGR03790 family protein [Deltaproteobacteria bacterium]
MCYGRFLTALYLVVGTLLVPACPAGAAVRPDQLVLVVNRAVPEGSSIARYYMDKRRVPRQNMIVVETTTKEDVGREDYDREIAAPVRSFLLKNDPTMSRFSCLVLIYGIPLRISPPLLEPFDRIRLRELHMQLARLKEREQAATGRSPREIKEIKDDIARTENEISRVSKARQVASVDSELALVREDTYPLEGWLPNRYYAGFRGKKVAGMPLKVMAICRLDGPA